MNMCTKVMMLMMVGMTACAYGAKQGKTLQFTVKRTEAGPAETYKFKWKYATADFKTVEKEVDVNFKAGQKMSDEVTISDLHKHAMHRLRQAVRGYMKDVTINGKPVAEYDIKTLNQALDGPSSAVKASFVQHPDKNSFAMTTVG